jgi:SAM-dependent methyltransferase
MGESERTATRYTLSEEWQQLKERVDWMQAPLMREYVNRLVSGAPIAEGGHWATYARERHLTPLQARRGEGLRMVSLACGSGHIEETLVRDHRWPLRELVGLEYDSELRHAAEERFAGHPELRSEFLFFDLNGPTTTNRRFDVVFVCHALHHASDVERLLETMNALVEPDGLILGLDFFGPTRFQIEHDVRPLIEELFAALPAELRRDLSTPDAAVADRLGYDTIAEVRQADASESVHSSDLRTLLFSSFPVLEMRPMGGTLLRWLLRNRAGNFDPQNGAHLAILRLLQVIERELIALRRIRSDDLFFVLAKSARLPG